MMEETCMDNDLYSAVEPFGNKSSLSKLERYWEGFEGSYGLHTNRIVQFDPYASMSRSPVEYILSPFTVKEDLPNDAWVEEAFEAFVRDETVTLDSAIPAHLSPIVKNEIKISEEYLTEFAQSSEWENIVKVELPKNDSDEEMATCIYKILCNPQIGSNKNMSNNRLADFITHILPLLKNRNRLLFVLPGFPFKDQNRFRVPYGAECVDFSEISFMIRLHNLIQTLYQVHPYGADALVLSDGRLYKDIFYVSETQVEEYQWRIRYYRNKLNFQGDVSIIDLKEMIDRANHKGDISKITAHIEELIRTKYTKTPAYLSLLQGIKWNMNSKTLLGDLDENEAWSIIKLPRDQIKEGLRTRWDYYNAKAAESAIKYAAVNLMLKWTDLIKQFFPESIRCTVHPKNGQFALSMNFAWNGVAWSEKWPRSIRDIKTIPYYLLGEQSEVFLARMHSTGYPCFYTKEKNDRFFECAKNVLNSDGWNIGDIFGREFSIYDGMTLYELGKDDPNFAWERKCMSKEYYTTLLQFRISHYKKFGFGVHAIFRHGVLIGQMGLQVLDEQKGQLEYVVFLGKDFISKGIGTQLLTYLFQRCREEGIDVVYGVIRNDNDTAKKIASKFGGKALKTVAHYHQTGILYEIKLKRGD